LLKATPTNGDLLDLQKELGNIIAMQTDLINDIRPKLAQSTTTAPLNTTAPPTLQSATPTEQPKWSVENHPAFQNGARKPAQPAPPADETPVIHVYHVRDKVLALWKRAFYPATIQNILGSQSNPKYYVKYDGESEYATLEYHEIKPIESRKRKADMASAATPISFTSSSASVISAAPNLNPVLADQAKREPSKVSDGPARPQKIPKKLQQSKALDKNKNKWQEWQTSGKAGKKAKKDSMFRTPEGVNARGRYNCPLITANTDRNKLA
jgi:survival-of-motor-neuron-related-splicing factor 30